MPQFYTYAKLQRVHLLLTFFLKVNKEETNLRFFKPDIKTHSEYRIPRGVPPRWGHFNALGVEAMNHGLSQGQSSN